MHKNIRVGIVSDIKALLKIEESSFLPCDRFTYNQFYYFMKKGRGHFLVHSIYWVTVEGYVYVTEYGRIHSLAVHPAYRNNNIGGLLLESAESKIIDKKHSKLEVRQDNKKAIRFYTKNGYKAYGIRHNYYKDGMNAVIMKKDLSCQRKTGSS